MKINKQLISRPYSPEDIKNLPVHKGKMFLNSMYTDGYTCRLSFARKILPASPLSRISLELHDLTSEEVNTYFRPCTVDPNRKDVYASYHGNSDIRRLSSAEYYDMSGSTNRHKQEQQRKKILGLDQIETHIPSSKTTSFDNYTMHIIYMLQHIEALLHFYSFETARLRWCNYIGAQRSIENAVNILLNGSKKYNKSRRKRTKRNKRKRKKTASKYQYDPPSVFKKRGKNPIRYFHIHHKLFVL